MGLLVCFNFHRYSLWNEWMTAYTRWLDTGWSWSCTGWTRRPRPPPASLPPFVPSFTGRERRDLPRSSNSRSKRQMMSSWALDLRANRRRGDLCVKVCVAVAVFVAVVVAFVFSSPSRVEVSYSTKWSESCVVAIIVVSSAAASGNSGGGL